MTETDVNVLSFIVLGMASVGALAVALAPGLRRRRRIGRHFSGRRGSTLGGGGADTACRPASLGNGGGGTSARPAPTTTPAPTVLLPRSRGAASRGQVDSHPHLAAATTRAQRGEASVGAAATDVAGLRDPADVRRDRGVPPYLPVSSSTDRPGPALPTEPVRMTQPPPLPAETGAGDGGPGRPTQYAQQPDHRCHGAAGLSTEQHGG